MKMINRIIEPTSGSIRIDRQDVLRIVFVVDGYTTSDNYPYAERVSIGPNQLRRHIGHVIHQIGLFRT